MLKKKEEKKNIPNLVNRRRRKSKVIENSTSAIKSDSTDSDYEFSSKLNFNHSFNNVMLSEKSKSSFRGGGAVEKFLQLQKQHETNKIRYEIFSLHRKHDNYCGDLMRSVFITFLIANKMLIINLNV